MLPTLLFHNPLVVRIMIVFALTLTIPSSKSEIVIQNSQIVKGEMTDAYWIAKCREWGVRNVRDTFPDIRIVTYNNFSLITNIYKEPPILAYAFPFNSARLQEPSDIITRI